MLNNRGSILIEMILCVFISSLLLSFSLYYHGFSRQSYRIFCDQYLYLQTEAIRCGDWIAYEDPLQTLNLDIRFNKNGNVNTAMTLPFKMFQSERTVIELGMGRIVMYESRKK